MPIYTYKCDKCQELKEDWFPTFEDSSDNQPCRCGENSKRILNAGNTFLDHAKKFTGKLRPKKGIVDGKLVDFTK